MQHGRRPHCMARLLYCERRLLRARRFRTRRRGRTLLFVGFLQRIQNTTAARWHRGCSACGLRLRGRRDDRARLAIVAGKPRQKQACDEEAGSQDRRRPAQEIGRAPARHETGTAADAQAATFGFLQQHRGDQRRDDHQVDYDNDSLHFDLPSQTKTVRLCGSRFCGIVNSGRVLHDCTGRCHPRCRRALSPRQGFTLS